MALATWWSFAWPVVGALVGVALGVGFVHILENFVEVPTISETTAVMIGLGVGIDYGLFVVGRAKDYMDDGQAPIEAAGHALGTIGRAVLTAGATVVVALVALLVFEVPAVSAMAYAVVVVVSSVVLSALTLQPAIVGLVGTRLATSRVPWARRRGADEPARPTVMRRWAEVVTRHATPFLAGALLVLLVLAIPVFKGDLRLGPLDNSLFPTDSTQYRAWDIESDQFGPGSTDPFLVVVQIPSGDTSAQAEVTTLIQDVQQADGVAAVTPPQVSSDDSLAVFEVIPTTGAQAEATADLVTRLRDDTLPQATDGTDLTALVTGKNAVFVDLDDRIADRLPMFIGLVVLVAVVILGAVFRSLAIPVKAAIFNILTILATYGVLVAFLTYGWGRSWIGIPNDIPVLSLLAPVFFAVLFGLSNDYEVYLVSRMHEEREAGADATEAVRAGLGGGGRIVIAAALIMVFVFASYMFQPGAAIEQFGFGMAVAILLDAFVTRMTALPAVMHLGGDRMWWPGRRRPAAERQPQRRPAPVASATEAARPVLDGCEATRPTKPPTGSLPTTRAGATLIEALSKCRHGRNVDESRRVVAVGAMVPRVHMDHTTPAAIVSAAASRTPATAGRTAEVTLVARWLELAAAGAPRIGIVHGEAGVGKSHLLRVAAGEAHARGFRVLRASAFEGTPALLPVLTALAPLIEDARRGRRPDLTAGEVDALDLLFRGGSGEARVTSPRAVDDPTGYLAAVDLLIGAEHGSAAVRRHRPGRRPRRRQRHPAGPRRVGRGGPGGGGPRPARHRLRDAWRWPPDGPQGSRTAPRRARVHPRPVGVPRRGGAERAPDVPGPRQSVPAPPAGDPLVHRREPAARSSAVGAPDRDGCGRRRRRARAAARPGRPQRRPPGARRRDRHPPRGAEPDVPRPAPGGVGARSHRRRRHARRGHRGRPRQRPRRAGGGERRRGLRRRHQPTTASTTHCCRPRSAVR